ncbi:MAG: single-stranded-DNA-specific exonuclease RecJ [Actinomycetota bacterium]|nr:single-stranded-DNA-specific exonuclease RecJ [Actinomycetota bacterium]
MSDIPEYWNQKANCQVPENIQKSIKLSGYSLTFLKILSNRNLKTEEDIVKFLKDFSASDLYDPFLMPNIDIAAERLIKAINLKEKIVVFGDYDADGIISSHIISGFLKKCGLDVEVHIPDRVEEGYDINVNYVKDLRQKNPDVNLIICVDCGTNSTDVIQFIADNQDCADIVVTDHHIMNDGSYEIYKSYLKNRNEKFNRYIIVNPHLKYSRYPFQDLSGAAVSFKLINAVLIKIDKAIKNNFNKDYLTSLMDLLAISTVTDLMPLLDENRVIVKWGLKILEKTKNKGIKSLLKNVLPGKKEYSAYDLGFVIGPRLNASGRVENAMDSYDLISSESCRHDEIIVKINISNDKRKKIQADILKKILNDKNYDFEDIKKNKKIFIAKSSDWHEGLIGLIASEMVKKLHIPVILFKEEEHSIKGSGRSIEGFDLFKHLNAVSDIFHRFGGHKMACGITIISKDKSKNDIEDLFNTFKKKMENIAVKSIKDSHIQKKIKYDCEIDFTEISSGLYNELNKLEPFGISNPRPVFLSKKCRVKQIKFLKNYKHAQLLLEQSGCLIRAVKFNLEDDKLNDLKKLKEDDFVSVLYYLDENSYNGVSYLQLILLDLFYK